MTPVRLAGAMLWRDGRVLLGLRAPQAASYAGKWDVLGGHVEAGESFVSAMCREVLEEAGVQPTAFSEIAHVRSGKVELKIYRVVDWFGGEPKLLGNEHSRLRWFKPDEACALELSSKKLCALVRQFGT